MKSNLRFEYKYLLNFKQYYLIQNIIKFALTPDQQFSSNKYQVCSLYFDTPFYEFYHQKTEGLFVHNKIRLRQYRSQFDPHKEMWLESKQKRGKAQIKKRVLLNNYLSFLNYTSPLNENYFSNLNLITNLKPTLLVLYDREAFENVLEGERLRITFDSNLRFTNVQNQSFYNVRNALSLGSDDKFLLEIKYGNATLPLFILKIIKQYSLKSISFSKYTLGLDLLKLGYTNRDFHHIT